MQNSPQFVIGYYAILRADAVVVPVNPMNLSEELRHYVLDAARAPSSRRRTCGPRCAAAARRPGGRRCRCAPGLRHAVVAAYGDYLDGAHRPGRAGLRQRRASRSKNPAPAHGWTPWPPVCSPGPSPPAPTIWP